MPAKTPTVTIRTTAESRSLVLNKLRVRRLLSSVDMVKAHSEGLAFVD